MGMTLASTPSRWVVVFVPADHRPVDLRAAGRSWLASRTRAVRDVVTTRHPCGAADPALAAARAVLMDNPPSTTTAPPADPASGSSCPTSVHSSDQTIARVAVRDMDRAGHRLVTSRDAIDPATPEGPARPTARRPGHDGRRDGRPTPGGWDRDRAGLGAAAETRRAGPRPMVAAGRDSIGPMGKPKPIFGRSTKVGRYVPVEHLAEDPLGRALVQLDRRSATARPGRRRRGRGRGPASRARWTWRPGRAW